MRIEQLSFTKFLPAIFIVISHFGKQVPPFNNHHVLFLIQHAHVGLSYFFLLSGFLMIIAYGDKPQVSSFGYFKNRFARIYPVYFSAIVFSLLLEIIDRNPIDYKGLFLNLFVIQAWVPGKALSFNPPGWSLSSEFFFYACFPFLLKLYVKEGYSKFVIPVVLFWLISQVFFHLFLHSDFYHGFPSRSHDLIYYFPLMHLNEFLAGNLAGLFFIKKLKDKPKNYDWNILIIILMIVFLMKHHSFGFNFHNGLLSFLLVPLILFISLNNGKITSFSKIKLMIFLGEITYGLYILQFPVFICVKDLFEYWDVKNNALMFYISFFSLILLSAMSYVFIEMPFRTAIKNWRLSKN